VLGVGLEPLDMAIDVAQKHVHHVTVEAFLDYDAQRRDVLAVLRESVLPALLPGKPGEQTSPGYGILCRRRMLSE
jgi:hypothetical protein